MFETLRNALKVKDIRKRLLFTLVVLVICRLGSQLPIPGIDTDTISQYLNSLLGDSFNLLNSFTGGSFESMSLFALNVTPYITASIIMQLLTIAIPKLDELQKDGEEGRKKLAEVTRYLTVALAKGRLAELAMELFISIGMDCSEMKEKTRKLIFTDEKNKMKFILVKASDVPTYVEYGAADIGIVGKDTLLEESRNLYEMVDLGFGKCKMAVCGPKELKGKLDTMTNLRVASKYPHIAMKYFQDDKGQTIEIIKLNGSVELAPLVGLSDVIVDIVETGKTLYENGLDVLEDVCPLSARFVVNKVSMKMETERIMNIVKQFEERITK
mgnify:CR=1 FL=1